VKSSGKYGIQERVWIMTKKKRRPEEIIPKLRAMEVHLSKG
jgi:hypothetical protein